MTHTYVAVVVATEVEEVEGGAYPEVKAWQPHQHGVLEALREVRLGRVPRTVPILGEERTTRTYIHDVTSHEVVLWQEQAASVGETTLLWMRTDGSVAFGPLGAEGHCGYITWLQQLETREGPFRSSRHNLW